MWRINYFFGRRQRSRQETPAIWKIELQLLEKLAKQVLVSLRSELRREETQRELNYGSATFKIFLG